MRQSRLICQILLCTFLIVTGFSAHAAGVIRDVKTNCGALGDGANDDTAAINTCISQLAPGDTLLFSCGTYKVSSQLTLPNNVVADGKSCAVIKGTVGGGNLILESGGISSSTPLTANSSVGDTTFQANLAAIGLVSGDYAFLEEGGVDVARSLTDPLGCSAAVPCRGEIVHIASVSGTTATIDTSVQTVPGLHFDYNFQTPSSIGCSSPFTSCPNANGAHVYKLKSPKTGVTIQNITLDGALTTNAVGIYLDNAVNITLSGVTVQNFALSGIFLSRTYNASLQNVRVSASGADGGWAAIEFKIGGHSQVDGVVLTNMRARSWPFFLGGSADNTVTNLEVQGGNVVTSRLFNLGAISYSTFDSINVHDSGPDNIDNGVSLQYYAQHLTFNSCRVVNTGSSGGIIGFGNDNSFNTFNNCTATGSKGWQIANAGLNDTNWTISGGTYANSIGGNDIIHLSGNSGHYIHDASIAGPGNTGINLNTATNSCSDNNSFVGGSGLSAGIFTSSSTVVGAGNILNGFSTNLTEGACGSDATAPAAPTGLTATVH